MIFPESLDLLYVVNKFDRFYGRHISLPLAVFHFNFLTRTSFFIKQTNYRLVISSDISYYGFLAPDQVLQLQLYKTV